MSWLPRFLRRGEEETGVPTTIPSDWMRKERCHCGALRNPDIVDWNGEIIKAPPLCTACGCVGRWTEVVCRTEQDIIRYRDVRKTKVVATRIVIWEKCYAVLLDNLKRRMESQVAEQVQGILKQDFETRIHEAMAQVLLEAASRTAEQNIKFVTGHLLAGCEQKDVPSSARVMNEVVIRLRKLAAEQVNHPLPTH